MFDINIPIFVWMCVCFVLFSCEIRKWIDMVVEYDKFDREFSHQCKQDEKIERESKEVPESVKHMFS